MALIDIDITNNNDNPPIIDNVSGAVGENAVTGTIVLYFSGSDADGDSIIYSIVSGNEYGAFGISGESLIVVDP
jgi:hypothetical protein